MWLGKVRNLRSVKADLADHLVEIAYRDDNGAPKTGRRYYYLALSHGYIQPDMSATDDGKKSRDAAYDRVTDVLAVLRKDGRLGWDMVLDLTRELDEWQTYRSPREARAAMRRRYDEDRWIGQPYYPIFLVEKDTMEPVCKPMALSWQMPFASSRGYGSLKLQHDVATMLGERYARTKQMAVIYFISDLDPSGLDLQRAWEQAMDDFGCVCFFERIALTPQQIEDDPALETLSLEVKRSDSRSTRFLEEYGDRYWEADILDAAVIQERLGQEINSWLDADLWNRRKAEIETARALL